MACAFSHGIDGYSGFHHRKQEKNVRTTTTNPSRCIFEQGNCAVFSLICSLNFVEWP